MNKDDKRILLGLVAIALIVAVGVAATYYVLRDEAPRVTRIAKIGPNAKQARIDNFFNSRVKNWTEEHSNYVWELDGSTVYEDELFNSFDITTDKQKQAIVKEFKKRGGKRFLQTCKQLNAKNESWSLGYCLMEKVSFEEVKS